jgi:Protein of unknown function (DUF2911)
MQLRTFTSLTCNCILATAGLAPIALPPVEKAVAQQPAAVPSPPVTATVSLDGKDVTIKFGAPSMRGRKIFGGLVPYDTVWRTGANEATSFVTQANLKIGGTTVPAGSYTLYTLPNPTRWLLIINKQTGQWGTVYNEPMDLARVAMQSATLSTPQEKLSITFENTHGNTTELHIRWDTTNQYLPITAAQ